MSIASEITRINNNIADAYTEVSNKGGTLPVTQNSANLAYAIASITGGGSDNLIEITSVSDLQNITYPTPEMVAVIYDHVAASKTSINVDAPNYVRGPFVGFPTTITIEDDPSVWGSSPTPFENCMYQLGANRPQSDSNHLLVSGCPLSGSGNIKCCTIEGYAWSYPYGQQPGYLTISIDIQNDHICTAVYKQQTSTVSSRNNCNTFVLDTTESDGLELFSDVNLYCSNNNPGLVTGILFQNFTVASGWGTPLTTSFIFDKICVVEPSYIAGVNNLYTFEERYNEWLEWQVSGPVR